MAKKRNDAKRLTADDVRKALLLRFEGKQWAVFWEAGCYVGGRCGRGDFLAMNMWPSRGLAIHGVEIKASRSDWLRELKQPEKAEGLFCYCDHWWLAVTDADIIKEGELPSSWGLLVCRSGKMVQTVQAPKLKPEPVDRGFVAELLRRSSEDLHTKLSDARWEGYREAEARNGTDEEQRLRGDLERLQQSVADFQKASGIKIEDYGGEYLGRKVAELERIRGFRNATEFKAHKELLDAREHLQRYITLIDGDLAKLEAMVRIARGADADP